MRRDGEAPPSASSPPSAPASPEYAAWLRVNEWNARAYDHLRRRLRACGSVLPKISVVMPVFDPDPRFLDSAIGSVVKQAYPAWELCIADDRSTDPRVRELLRRWADHEPRIRLVFRNENGNISRATNSAAELASGEFLAFLDHDDELSPDALGEVALHLAAHPETDFLYTDDDKCDARGNRYDPQFKPDWSPELLLSYMYMSHLCVARRSLFEDVGGIRVGFEGSQDYDFALRATERARAIGHVPLVLYHWRAVPSSTASGGAAKPASFEAGRRAIQEALERRGSRGTVVQPTWAIAASVGIFDQEFGDDGPSVSILIPTRNGRTRLQRCLESLQSTTYRNYSVIVIDNESDDPQTLEYLRGLPHRVLRIANPGTRFNFAAINNRAAELVSGDYVLFLNDDTEVLEPRWLSRMVGSAQIPGVGAVGARLLFPDGRIQHAGIVHGLYHGLAGPAFKLAPAWDNGYLSYAKVVRNYSAVTAACLLTSRKLFQELGGFDERTFAVAYNDVDFCYRLVDAGFRCVYCPGAELLHHEGLSRGFADDPREPAAFREKYRDRRDPYYSPHLSRDHERFMIEPRHVALGSPPPIRTLMAAHNLNWEGAPYSQYELTVRLRDEGIVDPIVYCPHDGPLAEAYRTQRIPVEVAPHPLRDAVTSEAYEAAVGALAVQLHRWDVSVVYANTLQTFYAIAAAARAGIPSVWNPRESEPWESYFDHFGPAIAGEALRCFGYPYRVIFVSEATRSRYLSLNGRHNMTVVRNGLNLKRLRDSAAAWTRRRARELLGAAEDEVLILCLGTVCERKGQLDLARAVERLPRASWGQVRCFVVGDRPNEYSRRLRACVAELPAILRNRFMVLSETHETAAFYRAADVFVCCSRLESYPRVILEAMAFGLPIVTTPVFGIAEQVQEGVNALLYAPGEVDRLAAHLVTLIEDKAERRRLASNSPIVLDTLTSFDEMVEQYARILREAYFSIGGLPPACPPASAGRA